MIFSTDPHNYKYVTQEYEVHEALDFLMEQPRLGYDVETTGLHIIDGRSKLLLMQLGTEEMAYLFDPRKIDAQLLKPVLESPDILKVGHNLKFDYQATRVETGIILTNIFDTMLAYRLLTSGLIEDGQGGYLPNGFRDKNKRRFPYKALNFLTQKYLGVTLDKSVRTSFIDHQYHKEFTPRQLQYAADDILYIHPLCDILSQQLQEQDLIDTALLEFEFVTPTAEMEISGVSIDEDTWRLIIEDARRQAEGYKLQAAAVMEPLSDQNTLFGRTTINIKSQDQLLDIFHKLGYTMESTDKGQLKKCDHELADLILNYRAYEKLISTYGEAVLRKINRTTKRLHFTIHQLGADTGRVSSEKPNIQNIPNDRADPNSEVKLSFRDCFVAAPGNRILTADYSQCIAEDELISSQWGLVPIRDFQASPISLIDLKSGEETKDMLAHRVPAYQSGGLVETNFVLSKGVKHTVRVKTADGFELNCTPDHLIKVVDNLGREQWKQAGTLSASDILVLSRDWVQDSSHPSVGVSPEEALFFGYFIGDGSFSSGGIQIAKGEEKYKDVYGVLNDICINNFRKELKDYPNTSSWDLIGKQFHRLWEHVGIKKGCTAHSKEVPDTILRGGRLLISSFLRGLFEADGWVVNNKSNHMVAFSTRSEKLSRQVQLLLLSLGIFSKRASYLENTTIGGRTYSGIQHRVSVCDTFNTRKFYDEVGFVSLEKKRLLGSLVVNTHTSSSDYIVLSSEEKTHFKTLARHRDDYPQTRRTFFANYFNSSQEFIRHYSRTKLEEVCRSLGTPLVKEHLAFSRVSEIITDKPREVYDISVPSQNMFVAGGMFVHNCELRILAEVSQDRKFIEIFEQGGDLHIITSQEVFGYDDAHLDAYNRLKKKDTPDADLVALFSAKEVEMYKIVSDYRTKTKAINFGIAYGLSAWSLSDSFKIPMEEAEGILADYFATYSGIKRWLGHNARESIANRYSKTILGRKRFYRLPSPDDAEAFRRSKGAIRRAGNNAVIQGTNADITKEALIQLQKAYRNIGTAKILFTVHDEIVSECSIEKAQEVAEVKATVMRDAFRRFVKTVPVGTDDKVGVSIADHWTK